MCSSPPEVVTCGTSSNGGDVLIASDKGIGADARSGVIVVVTRDGSQGMTPGVSGRMSLQTGRSVLNCVSGALTIRSGNAVGEYPIYLYI